MRIISGRSVLAHAVRLFIEQGGEWHFYRADFLDGFYSDRDSNSRRARIEEEPPLTGRRQFDAFIGAAGEHLCARWSLGPAPSWTDDENRFLDCVIVAGGNEHFRSIYEQESPLAYRRRGILTEAEPLRRARMPKDATWWKHAEEREGLRPAPEDIEQSFRVALRPRQ